MNEWTFWIPITGMGDDFREAWEAALERLIEGIHKGEYTHPPEDLFGPDDEVPAAEILGGSLSDGFGINNGPEEPPTLTFDDDETAEGQ